MSKVPKTHAPAKSTSNPKPSNPKPPNPPPTDDQMYQVRDLASQLHYGFKNQPRVGADGRGSWEARFMRKFHAMLKLLVVAKFDELPPFAIGCVWENNRRIRAKEPKFDPERVISAKSPGHRAYWPHTEGRLRYTPAFKESPMCLKRERDIRDNWWRKSAPVRHHDDALAPETFGGMPEGQVVGEVGTDVAGEPSHSVNKNSEGRTEGGGIDEGESEVEKEGEGAETVPSRATRRRRGRGPKTTAAQTGGVTAEAKKSNMKGPRRSAGDAESEMEVDGEDSRGRGSGKGKASQGVSQVIQGRTRSASRRRAAAAAAAAHSTPVAAAHSTPVAAVAAAVTPVMPVPGAAAAAAPVAAAVPRRKVIAPSGPSSSSSKTRSKTKGKGKQPESAKSTLYDLQPEKVVSAFIAHTRPCDRCRKLDIACLFNPLVRSYCEPCREQKVKCSNAFKVPTDHCMATYLGYATFRMVSDPSTYGEPTFSPTNMPTPLPANIDWFRVLYENARGKGKTEIASKSAQTGTSHSVAVTTLHSHASPVSLTVPRGTAHHSGSSTPRKDRSRSVSYAPSGASSTMPEFSAASVEEPPPSPSALSEGSDNTPVEVPSTHQERSSDNRSSGSSSGAMSIDGEQRLDPPPAMVTPHGRSEAEIPEGQRPRMALRPSSSRRTDQIASLNVRGSEFDRGSTARQPLPPLPPPPAGVKRPVSSVHVVRRLEGKHFLDRGPVLILTDSVPGSWKALPCLGPRLPNGHYSVIPPPHSEEWRARWRKLAQIGRGDVPEVPKAETGHPAEPAPSSRPSTPPAQVFSISDNVLRLVRDTRTKFDEIALIKGQMQDNAKLQTHRSKEIMSRRVAAADGNSVHLEDLSSILDSLSEVNTVLARLAEVFESVPAVPVNWMALLDLLTQIHDLRDLYNVAWERFASLEEDVRPMRTEMQRVRYRVAEVQEQLDQVSNDAITACEPLIRNLYQQIDSRLTRLERGGPSPLPHAAQIGDVLKMLTRISEHVEQLERAAEADDFRTRIDGYISRYLADRGVADHLLRELGTATTETLSSGSAGSSVSHALHTIYPGPPTNSNVASVLTGDVPVVPPLCFPSAAAPRTPGEMAIPASTARHEQPVDGHGTGIGGSSTVDVPGPSVVSKMHKRFYGRGSSSAQHGG